MKFNLTPEEAQPIASAVRRHLLRQKMEVKFEAAAWPDAPLRTTLVATKSQLVKLVEAQGIVNYHKALKELSAWLAQKRLYVELYIATDAEAMVPIGMLEKMKRDGVGLLIVEENGKVIVSSKALNPALIVIPEPTLKYGGYELEVLNAVQKFNEVDRKDGLRDMCELVEHATADLAMSLARKKHLKINEKDVMAKSWSDQINILAAHDAYNSGYSPIITSHLKADLHSFRDARNLVDHKVISKRADMRRQIQFAERMMQGPRLVSELASLKRGAR